MKRKIDKRFFLKSSNCRKDSRRFSTYITACLESLSLGAEWNFLKKSIFSGNRCSKYLRRPCKHSDETFTESVRLVSLDWKLCDSPDLGISCPWRLLVPWSLDTLSVLIRPVCERDRWVDAILCRCPVLTERLCVCGCSSCRNLSTSEVCSLRNRGEKKKESLSPPRPLPLFQSCGCCFVSHLWEIKACTVNVIWINAS